MSFGGFWLRRHDDMPCVPSKRFWIVLQKCFKFCSSIAISTRKSSEHKMSSFQLHQLVRLKGLNNAGFNGKLAEIGSFPSSQVYCNGRYRVALLDEATVPLRQFVDVKPENMEHACSRCHKGGEKLMLCAKCKNARYCDRECQRIDWENHKSECIMCGVSRDATKNPLMLAIAGDDLRLVQKLVQEDGIHVDTTSNTTNKTALMAAAVEGKVSIVQYLLQQGADKNKADNWGATALHLAALHGHIAVVRCLVEQGADKEKPEILGASPLLVAADTGHIAVVRYLLEQGADKNKTIDNGSTPLYTAAHTGHLTVVRYLLDQGADKDRAANKGGSPLLVAAQYGHLSVVRCLVDQGADKDKANNDGMSPLFYAAQQGHLPVVRLLLEQGVDKEKTSNKGASSLFIAAYIGQLTVVRLLVEHGANVNKATNNGLTPLHIAAHFDHAEILSCLMSAGASLIARDHNGQLPIDMAANEEIKKLIRDEEKSRRESPK